MADKSHRRKLFVEAMIVTGGNQTKSAIAAGHKPGDGAEKAGVKYMKDPQVKKMLKARQAAQVRQMRITADETMTSLSRDVKFNPRQVMLATGVPKEIVDKLDDDTLAALRGYKVKPIVIGRGRRAKVVYEVEVKLPEKTAAREQAMKHFGLYERDNKQKPFYTPPALIVKGVPGRGK